MTTSRYPEITDELLSAYIDNAVSEEERALIQRAVLEDASIAWRLATLQETVRLLRNLPVLQAPRSFVLTADQVGQPIPEPAPIAGVVTLEPQRMTDARATAPPLRVPSSSVRKWREWAEGWRAFWRAGSPIWRNAMAASMALLLVTLVLPTLLRTERSSEVTRSDTAALSAVPASDVALPTAIQQPDAMGQPDEMKVTLQRTGETSPATPSVEAPSETVQEQPAPGVRSSAVEVQPQAAALPDTSEEMALSGPHEDTLFPMMSPPMTNEEGAAGPYNPLSVPSIAAGAAPTAVPPHGPMLRESAAPLALQAAPQPSEQPSESGAAMTFSAVAPDAVHPTTMPEPEQAISAAAPTLTSAEAFESVEGESIEEESIEEESAAETGAGETIEALEEPGSASLPEEVTSSSAQSEQQAGVAAVAAPTNQEQQGSTTDGFPVNTSLSTALGALLPWVRLGSALALVLFCLLWWRSRHL